MAFASRLVDFTKPIDYNAVKGKTALITGAASGIGAATARALAEAGAVVVIADLNASAGEEHAKALRAEGFQASFLHTDVTSWTSQVAAFKHALSTSPTGNIDIVIACAGIAAGTMLQDSPFTASSPSSDPQPPTIQIAIININLIGAMYTATLATHYWQQSPSSNAKKRDNVLILVASNVAYYAAPGYTGYAASKWGLRGFWKSLKATEELQSLMRTNLLAPHIVRSPMTAGLQPLLDTKGIAMTEIKDCVECLMRLCCDAEIRGRAVEVNPKGSWFDLQDDLEDGDGSKAFNEHYEETKPVFGFMTNPSLSME